MKRLPQRVFVCLLAAGMVAGFGSAAAFAAGTEDSDIQTLALEPDDWTADGYQPYHGFSHGTLQIGGVEENETIEIATGETVALTIDPFAHVQYEGCDSGSLCCLEHCEDTCWIVGKGCVCNGTQSKWARLRLVDVSVTTDTDGIISYETDCDYSALEAVGDMTEGSIILTGRENGTVTVTIKAALYDWEDAETTFTVVVTGEENPNTAEPGDEDPGGVDPGIEEPGPADSGDEDSGNANPGDTDPGVVEPGPADRDDSGSGTDDPQPEKKRNGLIKGSDGKWGYYVDGVVDTNYTGYASNDNGDWYVVKGYVNFDQNSVYKDTDGVIGSRGTWYYVVGSKVQHTFTGLANYKNANGWWYIKNGKVDFTHNGVDKNKNGWYYVAGGKVQFGFTGLANYKNANGWWYIRAGKVDFTHNGVDNNKNGWWYVTGGKVQFGYTGVADYKNKNGWWYIGNGKVDFTFNGKASNKNGIWNIVNGKVVF